MSLTNSDAGHQTQGGEELAKRRRAEAQEAGRRTGIEYEVLDNHDGKLLPALDVREQVIREIRQWKADVVIGPRPNDYHPDHRYTGVLVQDASYMVIVPNIVKDTPPLPRNPVFLYYSDRFAKPQPFRPDIVVSIDDAFQKKIDMLDARPTDTPVHASSDISRWILQDGGPRWNRCLLPCRTLSFPATPRRTLIDAEIADVQTTMHFRLNERSDIITVELLR